MPKLPTEFDALFQEYFDYMTDENERPHKTLSEIDILSIHIVFLKIQARLNETFIKLQGELNLYTTNEDWKAQVDELKMKLTGAERKQWEKFEKGEECQ